MNTYWEGFLSLFYPRLCENCHRSLLSHEELLCLHCTRQLPKTNYHFEITNPLLIKFNGIASITNAFAFLKFSKKGIAQNLLHKLKYQNSPDIGIVLGRWLAQEIPKEMMATYDVIVPIPLHKTRERKRGYNQAEKMAIGISEISQIPTDIKIMTRTRHTRTQTKKGRIGRWLESENLYAIRKGRTVEGLKVLVVDDVITTGATIASAVNLLLENGADEVSIACIATGK